ncbi:MAG: metallophosphoesterase [Byssovorax sp.]
MALVSETPTVSIGEVARVAAALQRQLARDVNPLWHLNATISAFPSLDEVPIGYWPILITVRDLGGETGMHVDDHGQPFALVESSPTWSIAASHECIEMLVDPSGNRLLPGASPDDPSRRVEILVEVCDPCQDVSFAYPINDGVLVSDFCTPAYYEPVTSPGTRYSFTGAVTEPRQVLRNGYLSWFDPDANMWFQKSFIGAQSRVAPLGSMVRGSRSLREMVNGQTPDHLASTRLSAVPADARVAAVRASAASSARAARLLARIDELTVGEEKKPPSPSKSNAKPAISVLSPADHAGEIKAAIARVSGMDDSPDRGKVLKALMSAHAHLARDPGAGGIWAKDIDPETEYYLAIVQSALTTTPHEYVELTARGIPGFKQYENEDIRWLGALLAHLLSSKVPFPVAATAGEIVIEIPEKVSVAIAGDWGTGNLSSEAIGREMDLLEPDITIHLGDVYYTGEPPEEAKKLVKGWPRGKLGSFALNSNHEMYSGGRGYFGTALMTAPGAKFNRQKGYSYFALRNRSWIILGLDSAHEAAFISDHGKLNEAQVAWLQELKAKNIIGDRRIIVMTHHHAREMNGSYVSALWGAVYGALGRAPDYWYWAHIHGVAVFKPDTVGHGTTEVRFKGRLVGHGGVPYRADKAEDIKAWMSKILWLEDRVAHDPETKERLLNGFLVITLGEDGLDEKLYDENGRVRWQT